MAANQRELAERFVRTTEGFAWSEAIAQELLHPGYEQTELPNVLNPNGQTSNVAETIARSAVSKKLLRAQTFTITSMLAAGATVVMEAQWSGEMAVDVGPLTAGKTIQAFFCMVFEFRDGLIHRIRNYDCFAPF